MDRLEVFQINDSKDPLGSFRDRHENLGMGQIPEDEFKMLVNSSLTKNKPFILEVPGLDKKALIKLTSTSLNPTLYQAETDQDPFEIQLQE